jgi:hypothetical protein
MRILLMANGARFILRGNGLGLSVDGRLDDGTVQAILAVPDAALWSPAAPHQYSWRVVRVLDERTLSCEDCFFSPQKNGTVKGAA